MIRWYKLVGRQVVPATMMASASQLGDIRERRVAESWHKGVQTSTVFLGLDHSFVPNGKPVLFETMIFGGKYDQATCRYYTYDEAERGHRVMAALTIPRRFLKLRSQNMRARRRMRMK